MTQRPDDVGEWTLQFSPSDESSVVISARTPMDIMPTFYTPDTLGNHPSLQRVAGQPSRSKFVRVYVCCIFFFFFYLCL